MSFLGESLSNHWIASCYYCCLEFWSRWTSIREQHLSRRWCGRVCPSLDCDNCKAPGRGQRAWPFICSDTLPTLHYDSNHADAFWLRLLGAPLHRTSVYCVPAEWVQCLRDAFQWHSLHLIAIKLDYPIPEIALKPHLTRNSLPNTVSHSVQR